MEFVLLLVGFFFLIKGADVFVEGSSSIAKRFNVPPMVIGLTIVAMGTSAPEAAVSITSSLAGQNDMAVANVVGSNFFNILMVLGVSSILATLPVEETTIKKDSPFLIFISVLLFLFCIDMYISRVEGMLLLATFVYFLVDTIKTAMKETQGVANEESAVSIDAPKDTSLIFTIGLSLLGATGIVIGGDMVVDSATTIATNFGMSANLVGLTIVAVGTSLPEFVTSVVAIKKGETDIAIGNVIGSNVFNILFVLGLSTSINAIQISRLAVIDVIFMNLITLLLFVFMKKNNSLVKSQGFVLVGLYVAYMAYTIIR